MDTLKFFSKKYHFFISMNYLWLFKQFSFLNLSNSQADFAPEAFMK